MAGSLRPASPDATLPAGVVLRRLPGITAPRLERIAVLLILAYCCAHLLLLAHHAWSFTTDDTFISLRYARHLAEGHGLTWNLGEPRVEGYSNFLYVVLAAAFMAVGRIDPVLAVKVAGVLSLLGTVIVTYHLGRLWLRPIVAAVPPLLLIQYRGTVYWAVSGLETAAYGFAVVLALYLGLRSVYRPQSADEPLPNAGLRLGRLVGASACALLAALLRPEGPIVVLVLVAFLSWVQWRAQGPHGLVGRPLAALILPFALGYLAYFAWRVGYFGELLPNTVYCKAAYDGDPWILIRQFVTDTRYLPLALIPLFVRPDARNIVLYGPVGLYLLMLHGVSPTVAQMNRHFLAVFPLVYISAALGIVRIISLTGPRLRAPLRNAVGVILTLSLVPAVPSLDPAQLERLAGNYAQRQSVRERLGSWLKAEMESDEWYAIGDSGITPYVSGGKVIDLYCLNCREMTSAPVSFSPEKFANWVHERQPRFLVMHSGSKTDLEPLWPPHPELVAHTDFASYQLRERFNTNGRDFNYWVYERAGSP